MIHFFRRLCQEVKKLKQIFLLLVCLLLLGGCALKEEDDRGYLVFPTLQTAASSDCAPETETAAQTEGLKKNAEKDTLSLRACWLPYPELNPQKLLDIRLYRRYIRSLLQPLRRLAATDLFVQVRPFADAIYPSGLFESSASVVATRGDTLPFDFFAVILEEAALLDLRVHAWINPYRILSDAAKKETIDSDSAVGRLLRETGAPDVLETGSGLYLQPASDRAQKLILDGVRELLRGYEIAGVHLDDYFYPPDAARGDDVFFSAYRENGGKLEKPAWRREQVNALLRGVYRLVHAKEASLVVSVSPAGDLDKDYRVHAADAEKWAKEPGYCDWLIPQLYFGFDNVTLPFAKTAARWREVCRSETVKLIGGIAVYKAGKEDVHAGARGRDEWIRDDSLLAKQVRRLRKLNYDGVSFYAAEFVNFHEKACQMLERVL